MTKTASGRISSLGTAPIPTLLLRFSIPSIVSMVIESLYNLVDRYFVAHSVGYLGVAGITITFPISLIIMALALIVSVGGNTLFSLRLGAKKYGQASRIFNNSILLLALLALVVLIAGQIFAKPLLIQFGASAETLPYALSYLRIVLLGVFFQMLTPGFNNFIRSMGHPYAALVRSLVGAVVNIVLDWLFIVKWGWGIEGAAWATVIAQFAAWLTVVSFFFRKEISIRLNRKHMVLQPLFVRRIFIMGFPTGMLHLFGSIMNIILNRSLFFYGEASPYGGDMSISAFGIIHSVVMLVSMPVLGMVQATQPLFGFNYGNRRYDRVRETLKYGLIASVSFTVICWIIFRFWSFEIAGVFAPGNLQLQELTSRGMQIYTMMIPVMAFGMFAGNFFLGTGKPFRSLTVTVIRQVIVLIPLLLIVPRYFGLDGVFMAMPLSEVVALIVVAILLRIELKRMGELERSMQ